MRGGRSCHDRARNRSGHLSAMGRDPLFPGARLVQSRAAWQMAGYQPSIMEIGGPGATSEAADRRRPSGDAVRLRRLSRLSAEDGDRATERGRAAAEGQGGTEEHPHSLLPGLFHETRPFETHGYDEAATVPAWQ